MVEMGLSGTAAFFISVLSGASLVGLIGAWLVQKGRAPIAAPATAVAAGILWGGSLISLWGIGLLYLPTAALLSVASLTTWRAALRRPTRGALLILLTLLGTLIVLSLIISLLR